MSELFSRQQFKPRFGVGALFFLLLLSRTACAPHNAAPPKAATTNEGGGGGADGLDDANIRPGSSEVVPVSETSANANANASAASSGKPASSQAVPTTCAKTAAADDQLCVPDAAFVKRLCDASYPDTALLLMAKDSAFTHLYMKGDVDGWNADGGASTRSHLYFDEEVLALKRRTPPANSVVVGASSGFLVMRWDGSCFTLEDGEVTMKRPPNPKPGPIPWKSYSDRTKEALLKNPRILAAFQKRGKECKGASTGQVPLPCEKADTALTATVVVEVRGGVTIPQPDRHP